MFVKQKPKSTCYKCKRPRVIVTDMVIHVMTRPTERMTIHVPLCRTCSALMGANDTMGLTHLTAGGFERRLSPRQKAILARKERLAERKSLQSEIDWSDDMGDDE